MDRAITSMVYCWPLRFALPLWLVRGTLLHHQQLLLTDHLFTMATTARDLSQGPLYISFTTLGFKSGMQESV